MSEETQSNNGNIEERLVDFTDRALSGDAPVELPGEDEPALNELAQTVLKIKTMVEQDQPDPRISQRIKTRVKNAWYQEHPATKSLLTKDKKQPGMRFPLHTWLRFASAAALLVLVVVFVFSVSPEDLPGTANQNPGSLVVVAGAALFMVFILVITNRKK